MWLKSWSPNILWSTTVLDRCVCERMALITNINNSIQEPTPGYRIWKTNQILVYGVHSVIHENPMIQLIDTWGQHYSKPTNIDTHINMGIPNSNYEQQYGNIGGVPALGFWRKLVPSYQDHSLWMVQHINPLLFFLSLLTQNAICHLG